MSRFVFILLFILSTSCLSFGQPVIRVKYADDPEAIKKKVRYYIQHLNITENIHLSISYTRQIPYGVRGITFCLNTQHPGNYQYLVVRIDPGLSAMAQQKVLAHEMIHVKQYAKGELITTNKRQFIWKGTAYRARGYSRATPWETEAYKMERQLLKGFRRQYTELAANP